MDWPEIAQRVGYLDGRIAALAVTAWLQKVAVEQAPDHRRETLHLELRRLDALQAGFWEAAMAGDLAAATFVLKVIHRRCTILGFYRVEDDLSGNPRTIVIGGSEADYIAGLKAAVAATEQGATG